MAKFHHLRARKRGWGNDAFFETEEMNMGPVSGGKGKDTGRRRMLCWKWWWRARKKRPSGWCESRCTFCFPSWNPPTGHLAGPECVLSCNRIACRFLRIMTFDEMLACRLGHPYNQAYGDPLRPTTVPWVTNSSKHECHEMMHSKQSCILGLTPCKSMTQSS
jgi:hypothetical protein